MVEYLNLIGIYRRKKKKKGVEQVLTELLHKYFLTIMLHSTKCTISVSKTFLMVVNPSAFGLVSSCHLKKTSWKEEGKARRPRGRKNNKVSGKCEKCPGEVANISAISGVKLVDLLAVSMHY